MDMGPIRLAMMGIAENMIPLHELIEGEVAHFTRQGFTNEQARAMAAAEFVNAFGIQIYRAATRPEDEE